MKYALLSALLVAVAGCGPDVVQPSQELILKSSSSFASEVVPTVSCVHNNYSVELNLSGYTGSLTVYGLDVEIPDGLLFTAIEGDPSWGYLEGLQLQPDRVRVSAFRDAGTLQGESYKLAALRFRGIPTTSTVVFSVDVFTDDLLGYPRRGASCSAKPLTKESKVQ